MPVRALLLLALSSCTRAPAPPEVAASAADASTPTPRAPTALPDAPADAGPTLVEPEAPVPEAEASAAVGSVIEYLEGTKDQPDPVLDDAAPLLGPIVDDDGSVGCGCRLTTKGRPIFLQAAGSTRVLVHVRGADLVFSTDESDSGTLKGERLGVRLEVTLRNLGSACAEYGEACESSRSSVRLRATQGPRSATLTGTGECGC